MSTTKRATAEWRGDLKTGKGEIAVGSGAFKGPYSFRDRFENGPATNPEELLGAAHAGCFTMALSAQLTQAGHPPTYLHTVAHVRLDTVPGGFEIGRIELETEGTVPGIDDAKFQELATGAKEGCPLSKALKAVPEIVLKATLKN